MITQVPATHLPDPRDVFGGPDLFEELAQLPADEFRVVCLNIDADVEAGRRAARLCGAGLNHALAGPPVGGEPPRELPVFRILDRDSRVLGVFFGWQPALGEKIAALRR